MLLSKIMTSPTATKFLLDGVQAAPGSPEAARTVGRLAAYLTKVAKGRNGPEEEEAPYKAPWEE